MFEKLKQHPRIVVTGPQRSGTRICAKMIAHDTGHEYVDESEFDVFNYYRFLAVLRRQPVVIHAPGMSHIAHLLDAFVVVMHRPVEEILASQTRIDWSETNNHVLCLLHGRRSGNSCEVKYEDWNRNKSSCDHLDVDYHSLAAHALWIQPEHRKRFRWDQTQ